MRTIGFSGGLKLYTALIGVLLLQFILVVNAPGAAAINEKFEWKNASTIYVSGGVVGENRYELKKSMATFYDSSGNIKAKEAYVYTEDAAGILDVTRNCYLQFGVFVETKKANGQVQQLVPDPISVTAGNVCNDLGTLERSPVISNSDKADDAPEKLTVVITIRSPADETYTSDTVTLRGKDNKQLGKLEVKESDISNSENYKTAEVQFKNIDTKNESFLEACSQTLSLCSKSGNLAELIAGPLFDDRVFIEIQPRDAEEEANTSCAIDGIGWIICPVMNFLAEANEQAFGFLQNLLEIRPSLVQDKATVDVWSRFRDLANIAFVIAFLIIIYSQITSMGVSNYGIKKLLPKIAASAILVNLSLFICQVLVDVSNIAGASLYSFIENIAPVTSATADDSSWTNVMTGLLAAGVTVLLIAAIVLAPTVLLALGLILLILVARQAFILILVVIAPLAFVAYLLPNTEQWFKKWWKALSAMLLVYPIIAVVFGASTLASNILMRIADGTSGEEDSQLLAIVALGVMAIPLFAVPTLLKGAMAGAGTIGAKLANLQDRTNRIGRGQLGDRAKQMRGGLDNYRTEMATQKRGLGRFDAFRRGKLRRDSKYEALDARGKAAAAQFGVSDDRSRKYGMQKSDAEHKMKTANVELEASAVEARSLDEIVAHNVAQARLDSAGRVQQEAYSKEVLSNASVAKAAGGIDKYGQTRAVGLATQSLHKAYDDGVSAEKSTMSDNTHEELMSIMTNKNLSSERRAAAAGTIMSRDFAEGHLQALEAAGQIGRSGDDEFISDIQKQMAYDMKNKPFALGDQAAGQLKIGTYGKPQPKVVNADGTEFQPPQLGDLNAELRERIEKKLSPAGLAKMNPDELKRVHKMLKNNELSTEQKASMVSAITAARADEQYKGLIKPEAAKLHQDFLDFQ